MMKELNTSTTTLPQQQPLTLETSRYQAGKALGFGTFGEVFLATRRDDGLQVAIKRLKDPVEGWKNVQSLKEVAAMRSIPYHPSIVQPYEVVVGTEARLYLVFEYMPDDSLHELLYQTDNNQHGPRLLAEDLIQSLLRQILAGVAHCHEHSFFHRCVLGAACCVVCCVACCLLLRADKECVTIYLPNELGISNQKTSS